MSWGWDYAGALSSLSKVATGTTLGLTRGHSPGNEIPKGHSYGAEAWAWLGNHLGLNLIQSSEDWEEWETKAAPTGCSVRDRLGFDPSYATGKRCYLSEPQPPHL